MMTNSPDQSNDYGIVALETQTTNQFRILKQNGFSGVTLPIMVRVPDTDAQTAANFTAPFFIAQRTYQIIRVTERHETAATNADTMMIKKVPSGTAPASGTDTLSAGIALNATANTNQINTTLSTIKINQDASSRLVSGDALSLVTTGTLAALKGVTVAVLLRAI